jgi:hypothetical protein
MINVKSVVVTLVVFGFVGASIVSCGVSKPQNSSKTFGTKDNPEKKTEPAPETAPAPTDTQDDNSQPAAGNTASNDPSNNSVVNAPAVPTVSNTTNDAVTPDTITANNSEQEPVKKSLARIATFPAKLSVVKDTKTTEYDMTQLSPLVRVSEDFKSVNIGQSSKCPPNIGVLASDLKLVTSKAEVTYDELIDVMYKRETNVEFKEEGILTIPAGTNVFGTCSANSNVLEELSFHSETAFEIVVPVIVEQKQ